MTSQFIIDGYPKPFRLDRDSNGGGIRLYLREDIPCKQLYWCRWYLLSTDVDDTYYLLM